MQEVHDEHGALRVSCQWRCGCGRCNADMHGDVVHVGRYLVLPWKQPGDQVHRVVEVVNDERKVRLDNGDLVITAETEKL